MTGRIVSRRATKKDIAAFCDPAGRPTAKAWVAELAGEALALAGFALVNGRWIAFLDLTKRGREILNRNVLVQAHLIREIKLRMSEAREQGIKFIYADADKGIPGSDKFAELFGFEIDPRSKIYYRWKNSNGSN